MKFRFALSFMLAAGALFAAERQVAITFDDLPFAQSGKSTCDPEKIRERTAKLLKPFADRRIPVTGFVIGNGCKEVPEAERAEILKMWLKAGAKLENHTFTHPNLNQVTLDEYTAEIERTDAWMRKWLNIERGTFFRSPYLHVGETEEKKAGLEAFLKASKLRQGIVTIDNSDWLFANVYGKSKDRGDDAAVQQVTTEYTKYLDSVTAFFEERSKEVIGREIPQVLLLHANWLNADHVDAMLRVFEQRGYQFVSLSDAMKDPAYKMRDGYTGTNGISWIHRWGLAKDMPIQWEPREPQWLLDANKRLQN